MQKERTKQSRLIGASVMPIIRYDFAFEHEGAKFLASCRTHNTHLVEDEDTEMVLYDQYEPTFNLVYDAVPNVPSIGENGQMQSLEGWRAWVFFLPAFTLFFNLTFYWLS